MDAKEVCLLVVFVTITQEVQSWAAGYTESPLPCAPCDLELELTERQMEQADAGLDLVKGSTFKSFSPIPRMQLAMISLDDPQKRYVMDKFGVMFSSVPPTVTEDEVTDAPTRDFRRRKRDETFHFRVCPPDGQSYRDIQLGVNATGSPVQIIQLPGMKQWFLEEKCQSPFSFLSESIICMEVDRTTMALVINLEDPDLGIHLEPIRVQSCATFIQAT